MAKLDVTKIDRQIERLQKLRELAADPQMAALVASLFVPESTGEKTGRNRNVRRNGDSANDDLGAQMQTILKATLSINKPYSHSDVLRKMQETNYRFTAKNPTRAVSEALRKLSKRGVIKVVQEAAGRSPALYENVTKH